jgi:hypothetical protein
MITNHLPREYNVTGGPRCRWRCLRFEPFAVEIATQDYKVYYPAAHRDDRGRAIGEAAGLPDLRVIWKGSIQAH